MSKRVIKIGGIFAIIASFIYVLTIFYMFIILANIGLTTEMLDTPSEFLPWLSEHSKMFNGLWWIFILSVTFFIPVPVILYQKYKDSENPLSFIGLVVALIGIGLGILAPLFNISTSPILGELYTASGEIVEQNNLKTLSFIFGDIALVIRLFSSLFISLCLGIYGLIFIKNNDSVWLGSLNILVLAFVFVAVVLKAWTLIDLEAIAGLILAINYLFVGLYLVRSVSKRSDLILKNTG